MIGKRLSHFHVLEQLGEGGMGVVYRAEDEKLGRHVALKVLPPDLMQDEERRGRFVREARTAASLTHPNIATVHEIDDVDGVVFIAMELVEGETLDHRLQRDRPQVEESLRVAAQVADGLAEAHRAGIVHRDLKAENIMLAASGHAKILDFGLAKILEKERDDSSSGSRLQTISAEVTRDGRILGTAAYMSPEQARGLPLDVRSDIFSFGVLLYRMVTGELPFQGQTVTDTLTSILRDEPKPVVEFNSAIPAELDRILNRCLQKDPDLRYATGEQLAADVHALRRAGQTASLPTVSDMSVLRSGAALPVNGSGSRLKLAGLVGLLVLVAGAAALLLGWRGGSPAPPAPLPGEKALAVLPLANLADEADSKRLGQILQELIITDLSEARDLKVFSSQRLFDIRKQVRGGISGTIDRNVATEVARMAGASTMLTGSLSQLGSQWIMTAQLVNVADGSVVKSERIDGTDLYSMVDRLTGLLRADLGLAGASGQMVEMSVKDKTTGSMEAYEHFLAGVELLNDRDFQAADRELSKAVAEDPLFGQAVYKLAIARWWDAPDRRWWVASEVESPSDLLDNLLSGPARLTRKERALAEAIRPLVEGRFDAAREPFRRLVAEYPDEKEAWYGLGEALHHGTSGGDLEALDAFERVVELDPSFRLVFRHMSQIYTERRMFNRGISRIAALVDANPDDPSWYPELIQLMLFDGDVAGAEARLETALARTPDPGQRRTLLTRVAEGYGQVDDSARSQELLERALAVPTTNNQADLLRHLGWFHVNRFRHDIAEKYFFDALEHDPRRPETLQALGRFLFINRRQDEFADLVQASMKEEPDYFPYRVGGLVAQIVSLQPGAAEGNIREILDAVPDDVARKNIHMTAADIYGWMGDAERAVEWGRAAYALAPDDETIVNEMARMMVDQDRHEEAEGWLGRLAELNPLHWYARNGPIFLAQRRGDWETAISLSIAERDKDPGKWDWIFAYLGSHILAGRVEEADRLLETRLPLYLSASERASLLTTAGFFHLQAGNHPRAESLARRALSTHPDGLTTRPRRLLARSLMMQGRADEAEKALRKALDLWPTSQRYLTELGHIHLALQRPGDAVAIAEDLVKNGPRVQEAYRLLALARAEQGEWAKAEAAAKTAASMDGSRPNVVLLAWIKIAGGRDIDGGLELAQAAEELDQPAWADNELLPYHPSLEQCLGRAYLARGDRQRAIRHLERAAARRPDRQSIREDLRRARG